MAQTDERKVLAIESATDWLSVALLEGDDVLGERRSDSRMQHAAALLPAIDATLGSAGLSLDEIDAVAVSIGPGSFTSLRIGLATVKGLGFRRDFEAVGVSTLEAMALAGWAHEDATQVDAVLALLDARRGEWYAGSFARPASERSRPSPRLAEGLYAPAPMALAIEGSIGVVAPQAGAWEDALEAAGVDVRWRLAGETARPGAVWIGRLGQLRLDAGEGRAPADLVARYLRRAEAEAKRLGGPVEAGEVADLGASRTPR